jgi:hypothetical protein
LQRKNQTFNRFESQVKNGLAQIGDGLLESESGVNQLQDFGAHAEVLRDNFDQSGIDGSSRRNSSAIEGMSGMLGSESI